MTARANHGFMLGSFILIIMLFLTIFIFLMWAYKAFEKQDTKHQYRDNFEIVLDKSTLQQPVSIYINDSIIFSGIPNAVLTLNIQRFSEDNSILAVDNITDKVSIKDLPKEDCKITISRSESEIILNVTE